MKKFIKIAVSIMAFSLLVLLVGCGKFYFPRYSVNYFDGETLVYSQTVRTAENLKPPKLVDKNGYYVTDWKDSLGVSLSNEYPLKREGNSFYAVWSAKTYSITYELDGGENNPLNPTSYDLNSSIAFYEPTKQGFEFLGWTTSTISTPTKQLTIEEGSFGDLVLFANWADEKLKYLYFDTNGGSNISRISTDANSIEIPQKTPYRLGFEFSGWFLDENFLTPATSPLVLEDKVTTIYAKWQIITYSITCAEEGFSQIDYTVETETFTVPNISKEGYEFLGYTYLGVTKPEKDLQIKKGTAKSFELTAVFEVKRFTISFETFGGSQIEDKVLDFGALISALETPTKDDCEFLGWYVDAGLTTPLEFSAMPARDFTLYAKWYSDNQYPLTYSSQGASCEFGFNRASGTEVLCGDLVEISAPIYCNGGVFEYWLKDGEIYSYENELSFEMPNFSLSLTAFYSSIRTVSFDKSSNDDLVVYSGEKAITKIDGAGLKKADYENNSSTIKNSFLQKLSSGLYPILITYLDSSEYVLLEVKTDKNKLCNLDVDYDSLFPNVCILFDGVGDFEYSIDGSEYISCKSGDVIASYDKSKSHTVIVREKTNVENFVAVSKVGYDNEGKAYYESSFTYGGNSYDLVLDNRQEIDAFTHYFAYAYAPLNRAGSTLQYPGGVASMRYYVEDSFKEEVSSNVKEYLTAVFKTTGVPYAPAYSYTNLSGSKGNVGLIEIYFTTDTPCEILSAQEKTSKLQTQGLLRSSLRESDFDSFKINSFEKTQEIRTLYELENLPFGVKPILTNATEQAKQVYQKAQEILRLYVDDNMNDFEKVKAIYDYLALNVTYDDVVAQEGSVQTSAIGKYRAFTSYGALVDNISVCDGISSAFSLLCKLEGIECVEVTGLGNGGGHAWNKVKIYGKWYGVDATWSTLATPEGDYVSHRSFLIDEKELINSGHDENGFYEGEDAYMKYCSYVAVASLNYFNINFINGIDDFTATSTSDFKTIISYAIDSGATAIEVMINSNNSMSQMINSAQFEFGISLSYYSLGNGCYLFLIQ